MKDLETGYDIDRPGVMLERRNEGVQRQSSRLTSDEIEILAMVATGVTDREIADKLRLSQEAVKARVKEIFKKIKAPNRFQASLWAVMNL